jgi:hypothetical protein
MDILFFPHLIGFVVVSSTSLVSNGSSPGNFYRWLLLGSSPEFDTFVTICSSTNYLIGEISSVATCYEESSCGVAVSISTCYLSRVTTSITTCSKTCSCGKEVVVSWETSPSIFATLSSLLIVAIYFYVVSCVTTSIYFSLLILLAAWTYKTPMTGSCVVVTRGY